MSERSTKKRVIILVPVLVAVLALVSVLAAACGSSTTTTTTAAAGTATTMAPETATTAAASLSGELNGAGATFPQPVYVEWIGGFQQANPGVKMNYQGVGSGAGIQQFTNQTVDFGASDAFMKPEEVQAAEAARSGAKVLQIPTVFGSIVLSYNLAGSPALNLDSDTLANIFLGKITKWNDPALVTLNPGVQLPSADIKVVHRSDSSGTTNAFTSYLTAVSADWKAGPGTGKTVNWPVGVGGEGNPGVAAIIQQNQNAIGYVELAYAVQGNMPMASLKNSSGNMIVPSLDSTTKAAEGLQIPADFDILPLVMNSANPDAYPIVTDTYILAYDQTPADKATLLKAFLTWSLGDDGTAIAKSLGYAPLPADLKAAVMQVVDEIGSK